MESVKEKMTNVITKTKAEMARLDVELKNITKKLKGIDNNFIEELRNIIKEEIQHQLAMQYLEQQHQGPQGSLPQMLKQILEQKKEQIEKEILQQFQQFLLQVKTVKDVMKYLEVVIKETMACLLSKLEEQEPKLLEELDIIIKAHQEPEQSQQIISTKQKLKKLWNGWLMDRKRQYYQDQLSQKSCQYLDGKNLIDYAVIIEKEAHKICQLSVREAYNYAPIIIKEALLKKQLAQKPQRDRYYLKITCYMAMLSKDTTKPVSDFMYHACRYYV